MWTQELDRNMWEEGDRQDIQTKREKQNVHEEERNQIQGTAKEGQRKVKAELEDSKSSRKDQPLPVLLVVSPYSAPTEPRN